MSNYSDEPYGAHVVIARTPDQMQDAARELLEIAAWVQRRPVAPKHAQEAYCLVSQTTEGP